jgi:hypothetical protein
VSNTSFSERLSASEFSHEETVKLRERCRSIGLDFDIYNLWASTTGCLIMETTQLIQKDDPDFDALFAKANLKIIHGLQFAKHYVYELTNISSRTSNPAPQALLPPQILWTNSRRLGRAAGIDVPPCLHNNVSESEQRYLGDKYIAYVLGLIDSTQSNEVFYPYRIHPVPTAGDLVTTHDGLTFRVLAYIDSEDVYYGRREMHVVSNANLDGEQVAFLKKMGIYVSKPEADE